MKEGESEGVKEGGVRETNSQSTVKIGTDGGCRLPDSTQGCVECGNSHTRLAHHATPTILPTKVVVLKGLNACLPLLLLCLVP